MIYDVKNVSFRGASIVFLWRSAILILRECDEDVVSDVELMCFFAFKRLSIGM